MKTYHVGLTINRTGTAQFQARRSVDFLSCEIYHYYGERTSTKKEIQERLRANHATAQAEIQAQYPKVKRLSKIVN